MKNCCNICGKELSNDGSGNTVRSHKEHIIHSGIYGRLKSSTILCEQYYAQPMLKKWSDNNGV